MTFMTNLTFQLLLSYEQPETLHKAVGLIYGLFQMDLESLILALFHHTIPALLQASTLNVQSDSLPGSKSLTDPRGRALAKLCVMLLVSLNTARQSTPGRWSIIHSISYLIH